MKKEKEYTISIGLYPGILFGSRSYEEATHVTYVFYLPFIDFALEIEK